ncbi:MAG: type II toxin-antitoxin system HigA family antitoxin [Alphaproteobacteria bacterium]
MLIRPIRNEAEYEAALEEIERYFDREPVPGTPEADRFDILAMLIGAYERERWPIDPPEPIEAIQSYMEQRGYTQSDLADLLGSRSRASEILNRRRPLTMEMAWKLHRDWGLPAESLIRPYPTDAAPRSGRARSRLASRKLKTES